MHPAEGKETQEEVKKNDKITVTPRPMRYADKTTMIGKEPEPVFVEKMPKMQKSEERSRVAMIQCRL